MAVDIVTWEDLQVVHLQLLADLKQLFTPLTATEEKQWLNNSEVQKLLKVSANTI